MMTTNTDPTVPVDSTGDKIANARKAIAAGVSAGFAAAIPLVGAALTDGVVTGQEAGGVAAALSGAFVTVTYVTWQTVNKPKPSDVVALQAAVAAVPPIVVQGVDPTSVEFVGLPDLPADPADLTASTDVVDKPGPDHRAE